MAQYLKAGVVDSYSTAPFEDVAEFTSFGSEIDLTTQAGYPQRPARRVVVVSKGAGTKLGVKTVFSPGTARALVVAADGDFSDLQATAIAATPNTDVTRVRVYW